LERRCSLFDRLAPKVGEASSSPARKIETVLRAKARFAADMERENSTLLRNPKMVGFPRS
jgi:hypothetical protein